MCAKILIVDDDERLITVHSMILETEGFEVATAADGQSALNMINDFKPDLVLLDAMMPGFSGFDTLASIKSNSNYDNIKVVMLTALSNDDMRQKAIDLGVNDYIVKSQLSVVELIGKIKSIMSVA